MPELLAWAVGASLVVMLLLVAVARLIDQGSAALLPNPWLRPLLRNILLFGAVALTIYLYRGGELPANMTIGVAAVVIVLKTLTDMLGSVGSALPPRQRDKRTLRAGAEPPER